MIRTRTAAVVSAGLLLFLLTPPAAGTQGTAIVPTVKGYVISRSDQVLTVADGQRTKVRVVLTPRTKVAGARASAAAIAVEDLVRADGVATTDGSLEALYIEVVMTGDPVSLTRKRRTMGNFIMDWLVNGGPSISLP